MKKKLQINFGELGILYALLIFWLILIAFSPNFRNISAFQNIVREASFTGICGVGMTFVIISGDLDLSVASQVALCSCVLTLLLPKMGVFPSVILILLARRGARDLQRRAHREDEDPRVHRDARHDVRLPRARADRERPRRSSSRTGSSS